MKYNARRYNVVYLDGNGQIRADKVNLFEKGFDSIGECLDTLYGDRLIIEASIDNFYKDCATSYITDRLN